MSCGRSFLGLVAPVDLHWSRRKRMPMRRSPCRAPSGRVVDVGEELLYALDFTFLQGTFLQGEVSLPRRGRKPEGLLIHDLKRTFRLDSNQRGEDFPSARGTKNLNHPVCHCCAGLEPDGAWSRRPSACVWRSGYWFEPGQQIKQESPGRSPEDSCFMRSPDWTRTSNPSINSRMLCQLSYGGLFCFRCWFPLQRVITIPGLFGLRNLKCREVHHSLGCVLGLHS